MEAGPQRAKAKVKKQLQRGIVHWQPPSQCGENEESHNVRKTWLQKQWHKLTKDKSEISKRMDLTYPFRRIYINEEKRPIKDVREEYPWLFDEEEVCIN